MPLALPLGGIKDQETRYALERIGQQFPVNSANILTGTVADADLASPNNSTYKTVQTAFCRPAVDAVAGTYLFGTGTAIVSGGTVAATGSVTTFYFDDADITVAGKTAKLRLRAQILTNATAPVLTFTVGLYPITVAGAADALVPTAGTVVAGSTVAFTDPALSTITQGNSGDFTVPADGSYGFAVVTTDTLTADATVQLQAQLQQRVV